MEHLTPPSKLVQQWLGDFFGCVVSGELSHSERFLATRAAQWGADQELEACCLWVNSVDDDDCFGANLRAARRPKPPSLKEQALDVLQRYTSGEIVLMDSGIETIRRALEALPDD